MTRPNPGLVADLARLAAKYPPDDWDALSGFLRDPDRLAELAEMADRLGSASRNRARQVKHASRGPSVREALARLCGEDPARAERLEEVWARLRRRELLPEMRSVRAFAEATGLKTLESTRREQAVAEVMTQILDLPSDELAAALIHASAPDRELGEEYGRWVQLILGRDADRADRPGQVALGTASKTGEG
ncbi:MAG: hypothetical protein M3083_13370 [Actinomycetota bacterium]|nr:hypothetical protein [Actinomycetota bacterium]